MKCDNSIVKNGNVVRCSRKLEDRRGNEVGHFCTQHGEKLTYTPKLYALVYRDYWGTK